MRGEGRGKQPNPGELLIEGLNSAVSEAPSENAVEQCLCCELGWTAVLARGDAHKRHINSNEGNLLTWREEDSSNQGGSASSAGHYQE